MLTDTARGLQACLWVEFFVTKPHNNGNWKINTLWIYFLMEWSLPWSLGSKPVSNENIIVEMLFIRKETWSILTQNHWCIDIQTSKEQTRLYHKTDSFSWLYPDITSIILLT